MRSRQRTAATRRTPAASRPKNNQGRLDENGKLNISIPTDVSEHTSDYRYRIEARVTDEGNREISGTGYVNATFASFYLDAEPDQYVYAPGDRARMHITAIDYDGKPVRTHVKAQLQEWHWGKHENAVTRSTVEADTDAQGVALPPISTIPKRWRMARADHRAHSGETRRSTPTPICG